MKERVTLAKRPLKDGVVSLFLDFRVNGKRCRENLKLYLYPEKTPLDRTKNSETMRIANAERDRKEFELEQAEAGITVKKRPTLITLRDFVAKSLARKITDNTKKNILSAEAIAGPLMDSFVHQIDQGWFRKFIATMEDRGYKPNSIRLYVVIIRQLLNMAKDEQLIDFVPKTAALVPKKEKNVRTYLTMDEVRLLLDTDCHNPEVKRAFLFSCFTGLRISDIVALKKENIVGDNIVINQKKTLEPVIIPIGENARKFLDDGGLPFRLPRINTINRNVHIWVKKAGIPKRVTFHIARHSFATLALSAGADLYVTSRLLGHTSVNTTAIYAKIVDEARKKAVDAIPKL